MSSQLTRPSTPSSTASPALPSGAKRRAGTIDLETQSAYKFGLAVVLGVAAIWVSMPVAATAALVAVAVLIAGQALTVLAADPQAARSIRPRQFATTDGVLSAALAVFALAFVAGSAHSAALVAVVGGITLAGLRLRTRYVTR